MMSLTDVTGASVAGETTFEEQSECAQSERAKQQLKAVRPEFVKRVSAPVLNSLLDELRRRRVITQEEEVSVKAVADSTERARQVIDIVVNKGDKACSIMKKVLLEYDSYLSKSLGLG